MMKVCELCGKEFTASKYRPNTQKICSDPECQRKRQLANMKTWRQRNPHYFKQDDTRNLYWRETYKSRIRKWRKEHPEYFKKYREKYKDRHTEYMREYMRRYRMLKKKDKEASLPAAPAVKPPTPPQQPTEGQQ